MEKKDYLIERLEKKEFNKEPREKDKFELVSLDDNYIKFLIDNWKEN